MPQVHFQRLWEFLCQEFRALLSWQRSDRPWQLPFAAAVASGAPVAAGAYLELPLAGALGAVAGLSFLYLPATGLHHRIPVIMACAFAMVSSYALGLASHVVPGATIPVIACLTAAALLFCKAQAVIPPGPIFMVMTAAIAAFSPAPDFAAAVQNLGFFVLGCIWACAVALIYSACILRHHDPVHEFPPTLADLEVALVDAVITGLFVGASLAIATALGLERAYWVPVSCLAVMQGVTLRASWRRNVNRILGTALGVGLTWLLLPFLTNDWILFLAVALLTFLIETAVVRHYAFAAIFITPLTILLAERTGADSVSAALLMQTRLIDTVIGALVGLVGAFCLHNQNTRRIAKNGLAAIKPR